MSTPISGGENLLNVCCGEECGRSMAAVISPWKSVTAAGLCTGADAAGLFRVPHKHSSKDFPDDAMDDDDDEDEDENLRTFSYGNFPKSADGSANGLEAAFAIARYPGAFASRARLMGPVAAGPHDDTE
jgi:hypothetical protein